MNNIKENHAFFYGLLLFLASLLYLSPVYSESTSPIVQKDLDPQKETIHSIVEKINNLSSTLEKIDKNKENKDDLINNKILSFLTIVITVAIAVFAVFMGMYQMQLLSELNKFSLLRKKLSSKLEEMNVKVEEYETKNIKNDLVNQQKMITHIYIVNKLGFEINSYKMQHKIDTAFDRLIDFDKAKFGAQVLKENKDYVPIQVFQTLVNENHVIIDREARDILVIALSEKEG